MSTIRAIYAAFDLFPSAKGASTHISHMATSLFNHFDGGLLYTLGNPGYREHEVEDKVEVKRFTRTIPNYLQRATAFTQSLDAEIKQHSNLELVHFRDIWSGAAVLQRHRNYQTLFEVNGLPSIELPYRYPSMNSATLDKLRKLEQTCLMGSDWIVTPSQVIKQNLVERGISGDRISVVTNAADSKPSFASDSVLGELTGEPYLMYFGALQSWQGVDTLIKAFEMLQDLPLKLVIASSNRQKFIKPFNKLAEKLGVAENIVWKLQLEKPELNTLIRNAVLTVAPLKECSRNINQGCSPLKVFESWACGTPVIASDLPVVREILEDHVSGRIVPPDRPQSLARMIRFLWEYPELRRELGERGKTLIESTYCWEKIEQQMRSLYQSLLTNAGGSSNGLAK